MTVYLRFLYKTYINPELNSKKASLNLAPTKKRINKKSEKIENFIALNLSQCSEI